MDQYLKRPMEQMQRGMVNDENLVQKRMREDKVG